MPCYPLKSKGDHRQVSFSMKLIPLQKKLLTSWPAWQQKVSDIIVSCFLHLQMAKAGFVHCPSENEPDVACCFFCLLELEGWEPDDDPW